MPSKTVLKISHLPEDFTESKLIEYAKQFGPKTVKVYMPRSHKTFNSRGYAFISLDNEVSGPLMETLNNKFMFNKVLKCEVISKPDGNTFRRGSLMTFKKSDNEKNKQKAHLEKRKVNKELDIASKLRKTTRLQRKLKLLKDFEFTSCQ